jgi:SAM-dependent methyltransferase
VGLDFSESAIRVARERCVSIPNATFVAGDVLETDLGRRFDAIVGRLFLHEVMHADTPRLLQRLDAMLKPGGFICFHENSYFNPFARFFRAHLVGRFGVPKHGSEHELPFDRARFEMYRDHFRYCERYVEGVEFFQKIHQYLIPSRSERLARWSARLDHCLDTLQSRTGLLNDWSYTQTIYASQAVPRAVVFGGAASPRN